MDLDGSGYARQLRAERAAILANVSPAHRARILGRPAPYVEPKAHAITVNLKTGERTVTVAPDLIVPKPKPEPRPVVVPVIVVHPSRVAPSGPSPEAIISAILTATGISLYEFLREGRSNFKIGRARQMGYWLTKRIRPDMSLPEMGRMFRKDHTTIIAGARKGEEFKDTAPICDWLAHPAIVALMEKGGES
jgi:hypothetical protein